MTDLMQDFWSMRGMMTYLASGLSCRMDIMQKASVMPVDIGITTLRLANVRPWKKKQGSRLIKVGVVLAAEGR